ncbi:hypothetical protein K0M31_006226 [Melipona bicolor]|uniref:Uncharacterized protein n=1 Tax=Melipona bicolor TaxID=60889 RepID=A0AA40FT44_9HYME|nr:hypothetical protein K0M31_006226 [Melipona bicolor]
MNNVITIRERLFQNVGQFLQLWPTALRKGERSIPQSDIKIWQPKVFKVNFSQNRWKFLGSSFVSLHTALVGGFTSRFKVYVLVKLEIYWENFSPKDSAGSLRDLQEEHGCLYCVLACKDYAEMYVGIYACRYRLI